MSGDHGSQVFLIILEFLDVCACGVARVSVSVHCALSVPTICTRTHPCPSIPNTRASKMERGSRALCPYLEVKMPAGPLILVDAQNPLLKVLILTNASDVCLVPKVR